MDVELTLRNVFPPYLYPNQYVNGTQGSSAAQAAAGLTAGQTSDLDKVGAVYYYNFTYDYDRAATVQSGHLPDVGQVLAGRVDRAITLRYCMNPAWMRKRLDAIC